MRETSRGDRRREIGGKRQFRSAVPAYSTSTEILRLVPGIAIEYRAKLTVRNRDSVDRDGSDLHEEVLRRRGTKAIATQVQLGENVPGHAVAHIGSHPVLEGILQAGRRADRGCRT